MDAKRVKIAYKIFVLFAISIVLVSGDVVSVISGDSSSYSFGISNETGYENTI